jgi:integrase
MGKLSGAARVYFSIMLETGMRPSEILALKWEDYDGESIHVSKSIVWRKIKSCTKNHEVREVHVSSVLKKALGQHTTQLQKSYIFLNSNNDPCLDTELLNSEWKAALSWARVRYRIPYTCRHTRTAEMLAGGVQPAFAAAQLGHNLEMFYRTYSKWVHELRDNEQKDKLADNWTDNQDMITK